MAAPAVLPDLLAALVVPDSRSDADSFGCRWLRDVFAAKRRHDSGSAVRRPYPARCQLGVDPRLSGNLVRAYDENLCDQRGVSAIRSACCMVQPRRDVGTQHRGRTRRRDHRSPFDRWRCRTMAFGWLRSAQLRANDAMGDSWDSADRPWRSNGV